MGTKARRELRNRYRSLGLCRNAASHGPATRSGLCDACAQVYYRNARNARIARKAQGVCANSAAHGPASCGSLCTDCRKKQTKEKRARRNQPRPMCAFGASHGPAVAGARCAKCADRRAAAAARLAESNEKARVARVSARVAATWKEDAPKPRKESLMQLQAGRTGRADPVPHARAGAAGGA